MMESKHKDLCKKKAIKVKRGALCPHSLKNYNFPYPDGDRIAGSYECNICPYHSDNEKYHFNCTF